MSSLPNIIKASQYTNVTHQSASLSELAVKPRQDAKTAAPVTLESAEGQRDVILQEALEQAKNIVENARSYTMNQMRESAAQMNEEAARLKIVSYEEGFSKGMKEGREQGLQEGHAQGYQEGYEEGQALAIRQMQEQREKMQQEFRLLIEELTQSKQKILEQFQEGIEILSIEIAKKILNREISEGTAVPSIVSSVLEAYRDQEWAQIHVSEKNAELLLEDSVLMEKLQLVSKNLRIVPCADMTDGDCKIDLPDRMLDAGVDTQIKEIGYELHL
ncbi:FliH/SctL family protein [Clostridium minihomine]|uniref:FliH/SctL family protein n=1 Tax=Clostridium minihomine TaxID=2045012 RepID=UPI001FB324F9|nr:FliH/SctL family protein [Clostridium minihomine]